MTEQIQGAQPAPGLTEEQIDAIAKPFIRELGGDHWHSGEDGIKDNSDLYEFARALIADFLQRAGHYVTNDATREAALQEARKLGEERVTGLLGEALMCATDHLDFDALERSHCNSMAKVRRGLAAYAELSGNLIAARRAGSAIPASSCPHDGQCHPGFCPCSDKRRSQA